MRTALLVIASLCSWTASSRAGLINPSDPVPGHAGLSYFDLMKLVVTDLDPADDEAKSHQIVNYRHIEGKDA